ncbi:TonB-dependent receptor [soil metagenome]
MRKYGLTIVLLVGVQTFAQAQTRAIDSLRIKDTIISKYVSEVTIVGRGSKSDYQQMPEIVGTSIYAGKKNTLIVLDNVQGNVVTNTMRQVLAKVPGIQIWESDPSGMQIGIAARGLSPNRSWEFNVRQNGYDISADPFGYPEAYYNPQLQAVQRIEIVRGQGSLQYGPQFGGLVNYILRNGSEIKKPFEFETHQTVGGNALFNSFNAIGGKKGKLNYYGFFDHRNGNGWRENSRYFTNAGYGTVTYQVTPKFSITAELMHQVMRSQQAGGLVDSMLYADPRESLRSRNWFQITWTTPALIANYQLNASTRWNTRLFATIGNRNSVGFTQAITVKDSINAVTKDYNNRILNADQYRNYALESRIITDYNIGRLKNTLSGGIRLYTGTTYRQANGKGTAGSDYNMAAIGEYPGDYEFKSHNAAAFAENIFRLGDKLLVIPGVRYEWLQGAASGRTGFATDGSEMLLQNVTRSRSFVLGGIGAEYHITKSTELYANFSQAYRPIQFANLQAPPTTDVVDPDLKDAKGYNLDLGYRGKVKNFLQFDVSGFVLQYNNRVGAITPTGANYRLITNVGNSTSKGFEGYLEFNAVKAFTKSNKTDLILFGSYGYTDARYSSNHKDAATKGKRVENAPRNIFRGGITAGYKAFLLTGQFSYVDDCYSNANNTVEPTANAQNGLIPSYTVTDLTATYKLSSGLTFKTGINNLFDKTYFTRRAGGYPGPGALPADGRTFFLTVGVKL